MSAFHRELLALLESGRRVATATLAEGAGSTPGKPGHRMIVLLDGGIRFTIGGGPLEAMVIADCLERLRTGGNAVRSYRLVPDGPDAVGMVCGGTARVFIEVHEPEAQLMVFGAGHVGVEVIRKAAGLGLSLTVVDDRADVLAAAALGDDVQRIHCPAAYQGTLPDTRPDAMVVIVTRCHETDREILHRLAQRPLAYLGMIGSRRKVETVLAELESRGAPSDLRSRLRAPVGLDIGARSPAEIAISILAEVVAVRRGVERRLAWPRAKGRLAPAG